MPFLTRFAGRRMVSVFAGGRYFLPGGEYQGEEIFARRQKKRLTYVSRLMEAAAS